MWQSAYLARFTILAVDDQKPVVGPGSPRHDIILYKYNMKLARVANPQIGCDFREGNQQLAGTSYYKHIFGLFHQMSSRRFTPKLHFDSFGCYGICIAIAAGGGDF